jgi:pimeloyl-ACP methyl ester carboxylesterase
VSGLALVATRPDADGVETRRARDAAAVLARDGGGREIADAMLAKMLAPSAPAALVEQVRVMMAATPVPGIVGALGAMRDRPDSTPLLPTLLGLPTLVIAGADDQLVTVSQVSAMAAAIPGARLVVAPGAGHLPSLEAPAIVTDSLRTFLVGVG